LEILCNELSVEINKNYFYRQYLDKKGLKVPQLEESRIQKFKDEYQSLPVILSSFAKYLETPGFYSVPDELKIDSLSWCTLNNIEVMAEIFSAFFSGYGYGNLDKIPAWYVLKHLDLNSLTSLVESRKVITFTHGCSALCKALAVQLRDIRYGASVKRIYPQDKNSLSLKTDLSTEVFDKVVITTVLEDGIVSHPFFNRILDSYILNRSNTLVYKIQGTPLIDSFIINNAHEHGKLRLLHVNSNHPDYQMISVYSNGKLNQKQLDKSMRESLSSMGIDSPVLTALKQWDFFPHVGTELLQEDFYNQIDSRQGENGIYLGGSLICCSSLDKITEFVPFYVQKYF